MIDIGSAFFVKNHENFMKIFIFHHFMVEQRIMETSFPRKWKGREGMFSNGAAVSWGLPGVGSVREHHYNLVMIKDGCTIVDQSYASRYAASSAMYSLMQKYSLATLKVYDDKHDKTYICTNGCEFHINRDC